MNAKQRIVAELRAKPEQTAVQLAQAVGVQDATARNILHRLVEDGFVSKSLRRVFPGAEHIAPSSLRYSLTVQR
jgi:predicted ArsR family transcriptional regulator